MPEEIKYRLWVSSAPVQEHLDQLEAIFHLAGSAEKPLHVLIQAQDNSEPAAELVTALCRRLSWPYSGMIVTLGIIDAAAPRRYLDIALCCDLVAVVDGITVELPSNIEALARSSIARRTARRSFNESLDAQELFEAGIADVVLSSGDDASIQSYLHTASRRLNGQYAMIRARKRIHPLLPPMKGEPACL